MRIEKRNAKPVMGAAAKRTLALLAAILAVSLFIIWTASRQFQTPEHYSWE